jgi:hypothetical protein
VHITTTSQTHYANYNVTDAIKDIKKGMHRYEEKIKSGETSAGDTTRSEE